MTSLYLMFNIGHTARFHNKGMGGAFDPPTQVTIYSTHQNTMLPYCYSSTTLLLYTATLPYYPTTLLCSYYPSALPYYPSLLPFYHATLLCSYYPSFSFTFLPYYPSLLPFYHATLLFYLSILLPFSSTFLPCYPSLLLLP